MVDGNVGKDGHHQLNQNMKPEIEPYTTEFSYAVFNDNTVSQMVRNRPQSEIDLQEVVVALVRDKEAFIKRIMELESIAPRTIVLPDGKRMVWRCPDNLV